MRCNCCESLYNVTITMQTVGNEGMICHTCIEKAVKIFRINYWCFKMGERKLK